MSHPLLPSGPQSGSLSGSHCLDPNPQSGSIILMMIMITIVTMSTVIVVTEMAHRWRHRTTPSHSWDLCLLQGGILRRGAAAGGAQRRSPVASAGCLHGLGAFLRGARVPGLWRPAPVPPRPPPVPPAAAADAQVQRGRR